MQKTFRTAGDYGDCLYQLPVVRYHGGGILYCEAARYTRQYLVWDLWKPMVPLLMAQNYIRDVQPWVGQQTDYNLNDFRHNLALSIRSKELDSHIKSLCDWACESHGVPVEERDKAWLTVPEKRREASVVINRSLRYHNPRFPWASVVKRYGDDAVFIGHQEEYASFCSRFGAVPYLPTKNFLEAASVIAGCDLYIGNQSACYAICEGLKKQAILEVSPGGENCLFYREGIIHGIYGGLYRPILKS